MQNIQRVPGKHAGRDARELPNPKTRSLRSLVCERFQEEREDVFLPCGHNEISSQSGVHQTRHCDSGFRSWDTGLLSEPNQGTEDSAKKARVRIDLSETRSIQICREEKVKVNIINDWEEWDNFLGFDKEGFDWYLELYHPEEAKIFKTGDGNRYYMATYLIEAWSRLYQKYLEHVEDWGLIQSGHEALNKYGTINVRNS